MFGRLGARADEGLVEASEAVLAGRYVEYLEHRGLRPPAWAWTNLLAHGTAEGLRQAEATSAARRLTGANAWRPARSYLAGEVLDAAERTGSLAALQAAVLVPLELDLIAAEPPLEPSDAGEWAAHVLAVLDGHCSKPTGA